MNLFFSSSFLAMVSPPSFALSRIYCILAKPQCHTESTPPRASEGLNIYHNPNSLATICRAK